MKPPVPHPALPTEPREPVRTFTVAKRRATFFEPQAVQAGLVPSEYAEIDILTS